MWTFTGFVHFELPEKIHTEGLFKFHSNIYSLTDKRGPRTGKTGVYAGVYCEPNASDVTYNPRTSRIKQFLKILM